MLKTKLFAAAMLAAALGLSTTANAGPAELKPRPRKTWHPQGPGQARHPQKSKYRTAGGVEFACVR